MLLSISLGVIITNASGFLIYSTHRPKLRWVNFDYFSYGFPGTRSQIKIQFSEQVNRSESGTYVIFRDLNSAMYAYRGYGTAIDTWRTGLIPPVLKATLFSFTFKDEKVYMASMDIVTAPDKTHTLTYQEVTEEQLIDNIESF